MNSVALQSHQRIAGLDGLRGLAVCMVLGFHLYPRLVPGGWLGVSLFFTLSGFLITTVILRDRDSGTFTFTSFYARRIRRLLPAALLVLTVFAVSWTLLGWFNDNHRTDVLFALLQVANWQQIWEGTPYGTALASPVVHYWSLAIEEQAYVVLPLLLVVFGRRWMRIVAPVLFLASVAATFAADGDQSVIYFGTHTRAAEILTGVMVAVVFHSLVRRPGPAVSTTIATVGIAYLIVAALMLHLKDDVVYSGGLILTGIVSAMVIATIPTSHLVSVFDRRVFVWLGTVSYGMYLIHWPVLLTLKETSLPQWAQAPLTLLITLIAARFMHTRFELPMRFSVTKRKLLAAGSVGAATIGITFGLAVTAPASFEDIERIVNAPSNPRPDIGAPRIFSFGDSKMALFYRALQNREAALTLEERSVELFALSGSFTRIGCPIGAAGSMMNGDIEQDVGEGCDWSVFDTGTETSEIAVIWSGTWDATDRKIPELFGDRWVNLTDQGYRDWIAGEYRDLFVHLRRTRNISLYVFIDFLGKNSQHLTDEYTGFLGELETDGTVVVLNLEDYLDRVDFDSYFPDGTHVSIGEPTEFSPSDDNSGADLYEKWFEPALCTAIKEKTPSLLGERECPAIDYSPRVVRN